MRARIESAEEFVNEFMLFRALHPARRRRREYQPGTYRYRPGPTPKLNVDREMLKEMYLDLGMTAGQIGEMYEVSGSTVRRMLKRYGITKE